MALILGSGLGPLADEIDAACRLEVEDIPHHPHATVVGHAGQLVLGNLAGVQVVAWRGRVHFYEGWSMAEVGFPIRLAARLGAEIVILTNAAGGLGEQLVAGDLLLIADHVNLPGLVGHNPLRGPHDDRLGDRFVDLSGVYDGDLRALARKVAANQQLQLHEGIYAMVAGPHYETRAEGRLLRLLGGDAVGMSTVPEAIVARQAGLRVLGISVITNNVLSPAPAGTSHQEVLDVANQAKPKLVGLMCGILGELAGGGAR